MLNLLWRKPDEIIGEHYMCRWHIRRKIGRHNLYLHRYDGSDDDRALHDHPWRSISLLIWGRVSEITEDGEQTIWPFIPKFRSATNAHRIVLNSKHAYTLFFTFPKEREWGFHCSSGWVHWSKFTDAHAQGTGKNCNQP